MASIESLSLVLNHSRATGTAKLVLLGVANHDGDGGAYPSIPKLARYANCSERNVQRHLRDLERLGELRTIRNGGGSHRTAGHERPNLYVITLRCPDECDRTSQHRMSCAAVGCTERVTGASTSCRMHMRGTTDSPSLSTPDRVPDSPPPGDTHVTPPVTPTSPPPVTPTSPELDPRTTPELDDPSGPAARSSRQAAPTRRDLVTKFASEYRKQTGSAPSRAKRGRFAAALTQESFDLDAVLQAIPNVVTELTAADDDDEYYVIVDKLHTEIESVTPSLRRCPCFTEGAPGSSGG